MFKAVVFDMDGLMFDTERLVVKAWDHAGKQMGYAITEDIVVKTLGLNAEKTRKILNEIFGDSFDYDACRKIRIDYSERFIQENGVPVKKGLRELLHFLKANNFKMAVATSTEKERAERFLRMAEISEFFDCIICGDMIERGKPDPDIYLKAAELMKVSPNECIALEDSPAGILSAYRAGLKPVMIPDLVEPSEETGKLLYSKLPSLLEVIDLLKQAVTNKK